MSAPFVVVADDAPAARVIRRVVGRIRPVEVVDTDRDALDWIRRRESPRPAGFVLDFTVDREGRALPVAQAAVRRWIGLPVMLVSRSSDWPLENRAQVMGYEVIHGSDRTVLTNGLRAFAARALAVECQVPNLGVVIHAYAKRAGLTPKETKILRLLVSDGASHSAIASALGIAESTVKVHVRAILTKTCEDTALGVANALE